MNALVNVSDRYAVVLLTYISKLTTVYFGIIKLHGGIMNGTLVHGRRKDEEAM